ncbi:DUF397 domain-containing protein [Streptomyces sp. H10-C2]|uniref:DUF397 domain-containing protein n=1 Tax=unclassified Streptomyces TaxID=2593676 RepID=UPI0024BAEBEB|nr:MULTISPECIES: DUF397 domain-containing protein [unclassified Streptomyces]MDJ0341184.1 DUF397 domain-containing protein [Streptomyces sp. PH10-H1]MDJ0369463.1 DUF397 domain-containing protein [Streptomyces sp. H10-C2]
MSRPIWQKSSFSPEGGNNCIELAVIGGRAALRESTAPGAVVTTSSAPSPRRRRRRPWSCCPWGDGRARVVRTRRPTEPGTA